MIPDEILNKMSSILGRENPEAYRKGYRDAEKACQKEIAKLKAEIDELEYKETHLRRYVMQGGHS